MTEAPLSRNRAKWRYKIIPVGRIIFIFFKVRTHEKWLFPGIGKRAFLGCIFKILNKKFILCIFFIIFKYRVFEKGIFRILRKRKSRSPVHTGLGDFCFQESAFMGETQKEVWREGRVPGRRFLGIGKFKFRRRLFPGISSHVSGEFWE